MRVETIGDAVLYHGDALGVLKTIPSGSARCCVTSPPYYGLRDYGYDGQIGMEKTPAEYIAKLVAVFREVQRVLAADGTLWLNIGDSYASDDKCGGATGGKHSKSLHGNTSIGRLRKTTGLKSKNLIGIPWMLAFALRSDGWYLRSDIIWNKPNAMPESVKDRPTRAHEYIFLLTKSPKYHYDSNAIAEKAVSNTVKKCTDARPDKQRGHGRRHAGFNGRYAEKIRLDGIPTIRNKRSVWTVATRAFSGAHFATFPMDLIMPCILAGSVVGDTVLDPFGGAGTVALAGAQVGRKTITVEMNGEYLDIACRRIEAAYKQVPLFNNNSGAKTNL